MCHDYRDQSIKPLRLPRNWAANVRNAVLNVLGLVRITALSSRETLIEDGQMKLASKQRLEAEVAILREALRIVGSRMGRVPAHRRPQYTPVERMAILELRALCGWSKAETSRQFQISADTIRSWHQRVDDDTLIQSQAPVNRFPDFVRYTVQRMKLLCPTLGKVKIADTLARAGIHIGKTTVGRIVNEKPVMTPKPSDTGERRCRIVAKYPGHTWHADLTAVPISGGFWTNWIPNALWQHWPVCWWLLNVVDHYSRRSMGFAVFKNRPSSEDVTAALGRIMFAERVKPKHLIVDQGREFYCEHFRDVWCKAMNILPRYGAVGKHGSIAVVERFHKSIKEILRQTTIPEDQTQFESELAAIIGWYNEHRPHETLGGKTPNEVCFSRPPANEQPRIEPRPRWPHGSRCASPQVPVDGSPGDPFIIELDCYQNRRHLPVVRARRAA